MYRPGLQPQRRPRKLNDTHDASPLSLAANPELEMMVQPVLPLAAPSPLLPVTSAPQVLLQPVKDSWCRPYLPGASQPTEQLPTLHPRAHVLSAPKG